jgi:hypothetical protein
MESSDVKSARVDGKSGAGWRNGEADERARRRDPASHRTVASANRLHRSRRDRPDDGPERRSLHTAESDGGRGFVARFDVEKSSSNITLTTRLPAVVDHPDETKGDGPIAVPSALAKERSARFVEALQSARPRRIGAVSYGFSRKPHALIAHYAFSLRQPRDKSWFLDTAQAILRRIDSSDRTASIQTEESWRQLSRRTQWRRVR